MAWETAFLIKRWWNWGQRGYSDRGSEVLPGSCLYSRPLKVSTWYLTSISCDPRQDWVHSWALLLGKAARTWKEPHNTHTAMMFKRKWAPRTKVGMVKRESSDCLRETSGVDFVFLFMKSFCDHKMTLFLGALEFVKCFVKFDTEHNQVRQSKQVFSSTTWGAKKRSDLSQAP